MNLKLSKSEKFFLICNNVFMLVLSFVFLYPLWYILILSFNEGMDASMGGIYWWPRAFTIGNYYAVLKDSVIVDAFEISVSRTVIGTFASILVTSMVAYGLSRKELPGRKVLIIVFFITMLFNGGLIPYYLQIRNLGLMNKFLVYILPGMFSVWNMIVMKTSFKDISESIIESVKMDGAGYTRIYLQFVMPLSKPLLAALSLFTAVGHWNDWFAGAFFVTDIKFQPLQTYLLRVLNTTEATNIMQQQMNSKIKEAQMFHLGSITTKSVRMATVMVATAPILFIYPFLQRYFVKGVMIGSIKE